MIRLASILTVLVLFGPGCAIVLPAKLTEVGDAPKIGQGTCTVEAAPVSGNPQLLSAGYAVDKKAWSDAFVSNLTDQLKEAGVTVGEGEPVKVALVKFHFSAEDALEATFWFEVTYKDYTQTIKGFHSDDSLINSSSTQSAWRAAGDALNNLLKDEAFLAALKGS